MAYVIIFSKCQLSIPKDIDLSVNMIDPVYFAEYLPNIKAISLIIQLDETCHATKLEFMSLTGAVLHYKTNQDMEYTLDIILPNEIKASLLSLEIKDQSSELSFRLPASPQLDREGISPQNGKDAWTITRYPWEASDLQKHRSSVLLACSACQKPFLVKRGSILSWKPMPSENWAELMDFWHCHKPKTECEPKTVKDYNKALIPAKSTAMVGGSYFCIGKDSLINLDEKDGVIRCCHCRTQVGSVDQFGVFLLSKWNLVLLGESSLKSSFNGNVFVTSTICDQIEFHSIYSYYLQSDTDDTNDPQILIKIFNPNISYTTTELVSSKAGLKVFFSVDKADFPKLMQTTGDVEILKFPAPIIRETKRELEWINAHLPEKARRFGQWAVGVMERYQG